MLALVAGAVGVALLGLTVWGGSSEPAEVVDGPSQPARDGGRVVDVDGQLGEVETIEVRPATGWTIPADIEGHADGSVSGMLPTGTETVGAVVELGTDPATFVVRSAVARQLAYRVTVPGRVDTWRALAIGDHEGPDGLPGEEGAAVGPPAALPILLPSGATAIEVIDRSGDDEPFEVILLPPFDGPLRQDFDGPAGPAAGANGMPTIMPRSAWTSAGWSSGNESCGASPSESDHLQAIIVHHTVTTNDYSADQVDDLLRSIHYTHTRINGWCDIGYNFVVDRFGRIWEARTGSIQASIIGGHARGFNNNTLGVALLGQHHEGAWPAATATNEASNSAVQALAHWKLGAEGVDPNGRTWLRNRSSGTPQRLAGETWHYVPTVLGHRDVGLTSCPGSHGMDLVGGLPARLSAARDVSLPYGWEAWRAHEHGPGFVVADRNGGLRPAGAAEPWSAAPSGLGTQGPVVAVGGNPAGGYLLTAAGSLLAYGTAPAISGPGASGPVDLVVRGDGASGWVLEQSGSLRGFGGVGDLTPSSAVQQPVAAALTDQGEGYVLERSGRLVPVGGLPRTQVTLSPGTAAVDLDLARAGVGWVLAGNGALLGFGGHPDRRVTPTAEPVAVSAAVTEPGGWVLDRHGQLWPFGGARYVLPVSTDARAAAAADLDQVGMIYRPGFADGDDARFVDRLHRTFLGRAATDAEIDRSVTALEQGSGRLDLTAPLARSDEWAGASLDQMYRDVLGREPDPEGRAYWMGEIGRGLALQDLGVYFYGSAEYARSAGSEQAYVRRLYENLLHRPPDDEGLTYWTDRLRSGRAQPPDIAAGFYVSIESRRARATRLAQSILGSPPSAQRRDDLADRLASIGDTALAAELAAGADFYRLATGQDP